MADSFAEYGQNTNIPSENAVQYSSLNTGSTPVAPPATTTPNTGVPLAGSGFGAAFQGLGAGINGLISHHKDKQDFQKSLEELNAWNNGTHPNYTPGVSFQDYLARTKANLTKNHGYTPQETDAFQTRIGQNINTQRVNALNMGASPAAANAVLAGNNLDSELGFAASGAALSRLGDKQAMDAYGNAAEIAQNQGNLATSTDIARDADKGNYLRTATADNKKNLKSDNSAIATGFAGFGGSLTDAGIGAVGKFVGLGG